MGPPLWLELEHDHASCRLIQRHCSCFNIYQLKLSLAGMFLFVNFMRWPLIIIWFTLKPYDLYIANYVIYTEQYIKLGVDRPTILKLTPCCWIFCHEYFFIWLVVLKYTTYPMERSIGCRMAELEPIKGYNCTETAISQERLLWKKSIY